MKKFDSIEFILENCEVIKVPSDYILDVQVDDIKESFYRYASNASGFQETSPFMVFSINSKIKELRESNSFLFEVDSRTVGQRMLDLLQNRNDITGIEINTNTHRNKDTYVKVTTDCQCESCKRFPSDLERRKEMAIEKDREYFHCSGCLCPHCNKYKEIVTTHRNILPSWSGKSEYVNEWQQIHVNKDGDVLIAIYDPIDLTERRERDLTDYLEAFNNKKIFDSKKRMYSSR